MAGYTQPVYTTIGGTEQSSLIVASISAPVGPNKDGGLGQFDTLSGGEPLAKANKHRPGGMGYEVNYGALVVFSDLTIGRVYQWDRDWELERDLLQYAGRVNAWINEQPLDPDGNAYGKAKQYRGLFLGVNPGKADSTSQAIRLWELMFSITSRT